MSSSSLAVTLEEKSTNVRAVTEPRHRLLSSGMSALSRLSPGLAARLAELIFFHPPRRKAPEREAAWLQSSLREERSIGGRRIVTRSWGGGPTVLLVHGWAGRAGQMGAIATALAEQGFRALAFDGPAHGESSGRAAAMPDFVEIVERLAENAGGLLGIVGHSMGGAATAVAISDGLKVERAVLLGAPASLGNVVGHFSEQVGMPEAGRRAFADRLESRFGSDIWRRFSPVRLAPGLAVPALIIHDREDREVTHAQALAVADAWPGAELHTTVGLGHTRMLRDPLVVNRIVDQMVAARSASRASQTPRAP